MGSCSKQKVQKDYGQFSKGSFKFLFTFLGYLGYVWIELILLKLKTENWKYCNKIIFKCMNSNVRPNFNEKVIQKWDLWIPYTVHGT